ncbi:OmpA family protein [Pseudokordiimonas caeni]|uniref:OmpA family protein n=1 Tax=Pseudokordiimonas caeni TaxID=2997908 RepID=UPI0028126A31|nr:OmpA family protein [Pseudokordiimonas caeni]
MRFAHFPTLLAGLSMAAIAATTATADEGVYAGLELGGSIAGENEYKTPNSGMRISDEKNIGFVTGAFVGYDDGDKWRTEFSYSYRRNTLESFDILNPGAIPFGTNTRDGGYQRSHALMIGAKYNVATFGDWKTYVGAGIGLARLELDAYHIGKINVIDESDWEVAGQMSAEMVKPISDDMEFSAGYRYFRSAKADFASVDGPASFGFSAHEAFARLTWKFGKKAEPKPEPMPAPAPMPEPKPEPAPAPAPEPAPLPGPFMVFFDWDQATIRGDAEPIIAAAAKAFLERGAVEIISNGHADTSGALTYNDKLSLKRAEAVKNALVARGVPADKIDVKYFGERALLVQTADNVREPQNRRVEIVLGE